MIYWYVRLICKIIVKILLSSKAYGLENIPDKGPFILASNHCSHLDPVLITVLTNRKLHFLAKKELFENRCLGYLLRNSNCIELDREGIDRSALKQSLKVLHKGGGFLVFPEGTRSRDGKMGEAKLGAAMFAFSSNAPVIPVFVKGSAKALPPNATFIKSTRVSIHIGKMIIPPEINDKKTRSVEYKKLTDRIMQEIAALGKQAA